MSAEHAFTTLQLAHAVESRRKARSPMTDENDAPARFVRVDYAYNKALLTHAGITETGHSILRCVELETWGSFREFTTLSAGRIAELIGNRPVPSVARELRKLKDMHIIEVVAGNNYGSGNAGDTIRINTQVADWLTLAQAKDEVQHLKASKMIISNDISEMIKNDHFSDEVIKNDHFKNPEMIKNDHTEMIKNDHDLIDLKKKDITYMHTAHDAKNSAAQDVQELMNTATPDTEYVPAPVISYWIKMHDARQIALPFGVAGSVQQRLSALVERFSVSAVEGAIFAAFDAYDIGRLTGSPPTWCKWLETYCENKATYDTLPERKLRAQQSKHSAGTPQTQLSVEARLNAYN